jgi:hypothetical protein
VKNLANDYRVIPTYIYAYQDKFKALPGDDAAASTHLAGPPPADNASTPAGKQGNGAIDGLWNSTSATDESYLFWEHVRMANLAAGPTNPADPSYIPRNAMTGPIGVSSTGATQLQISGMSGTYQVCSAGIPGKFAKQLDVQMDDGATDTGSMRAVLDGSTFPTAGVATAAIVEGNNYTVCMTF